MYINVYIYIYIYTRILGPPKAGHNNRHTTLLILKSKVLKKKKGFYFPEKMYFKNVFWCFLCVLYDKLLF